MTASTLQNLRGCRIVLQGDRGVGKTSLAIRYVFDLYSDYWDPTGEESVHSYRGTRMPFYSIAEAFVEPYRKIATVDEERLLVEVLDISGEHPCDRDSIMLNRAYGVMFVYSVSSRRSFERISELHGEAVRLREQENFPMIVVANKCEFDGTSREVSAAEGQKLADSLSCEFIETSCSRDMNVQEAFATLLHAMIINQKEGGADLLRYGPDRTKTGCFSGCVVA